MQVLTFVQCRSCYNVDFSIVASRAVTCNVKSIIPMWWLWFWTRDFIFLDNMHGCQNFCSLFNVVVVVMLILVQLQAEKQQYAMSNPSFQCDDFDFELLILYFRMACLVVKKNFLSLNCVKDFLQWRQITCL